MTLPGLLMGRSLAAASKPVNWPMTRLVGPHQTLPATVRFVAYVGAGFKPALLENDSRLCHCSQLHQTSPDVRPHPRFLVPIRHLGSENMLASISGMYHSETAIKPACIKSMENAEFLWPDIYKINSRARLGDTMRSRSILLVAIAASTVALVTVAACGEDEAAPTAVPTTAASGAPAGTGASTASLPDKIRAPHFVNSFPAHGETLVQTPEVVVFNFDFNLNPGSAIDISRDGQ